MGSVIRHGDYFYMVYCGFEHVTNSRLGFARSKDGDPLGATSRKSCHYRAGKQGWWDGGYTGKASLLFDEGVWKMWYTGHFTT